MCKSKRRVQLLDADQREACLGLPKFVMALFDLRTLFLVSCTCTKISDKSSQYQYLFISNTTVVLLQLKLLQTTCLLDSAMSM